MACASLHDLLKATPFDLDALMTILKKGSG
jgi:hypothetical protein